MKMMEELQTMWDGQMGTIKEAQHSIELTPPDDRAIHSVPYRAGPAAYTF